MFQKFYKTLPGKWKMLNPSDCKMVPFLLCFIKPDVFNSLSQEVAINRSNNCFLLVASLQIASEVSVFNLTNWEMEADLIRQCPRFAPVDCLTEKHTFALMVAEALWTLYSWLKKCTSFYNIETILNHIMPMLSCVLICLAIIGITFQKGIFCEYLLITMINV